jgi:nucleoside 2-deoxyribosyltransferase
VAAVCNEPRRPRAGGRGPRGLRRPHVDDGTAWEIGYAYGRNTQVYGLRTDVRITQQADEPINLMVLESLRELAPTLEQLLCMLRSAERS